MDAQTIALAMAAVLTVPLSTLFKMYIFGDPEKAWIEFVVAFVLAYVASVSTGMPWLPTAPLADPVEFFATLWAHAAPVVAIALIIFEYFKKNIKSMVLKARSEE